jgi:hypothetical protein
MKLDAKAVAALTLPASKADHFEWDSELSGFGFRLRRGSGGKCCAPGMSSIAEVVAPADCCSARRAC